MTFDHLAYLVRDTAQSVEAFRTIFPDVRLLRQRHESQGAYISYLSTDDGRMTIELVEPFDENKLLADRLRRENQRCLPYHICFRVDDFEAEYLRMREQGWLTLTRPFAGLGSATQAAHLYHPAAGIVEIVGGRSTGSDG
jgi:catechol 2,3-dioxygenase-like lactoylglutathione lyase family enzyme